jgi:predicted nucleic acid-binding protein
MPESYLLDTSVIVDVLNGKRNRAALIRTLAAEGHKLACCAVNVAEIYAGMRPGEEKKTSALLRGMNYFEITWEAAQLAGELQSRYRNRGRTLFLPDTLIAAVTLVNDLVLITDNKRDFPMPEIRLYPL